MLLRARIRRFARVVIVRAGRIDRDAIGQALLLKEMAHHALGSRAAADIAHADEKQIHGGVSMQKVRQA
jgi:hypothetical protein